MIMHTSTQDTTTVSSIAHYYYCCCHYTSIIQGLVHNIGTRGVSVTLCHDRAFIERKKKHKKTLLMQQTQGFQI